MPQKISRERAAFHQWFRNCLRASYEFMLQVEPNEAQAKLAFGGLVLDGIRKAYGEKFWRRHGPRLRREFIHTLTKSVAGPATPSTTQQPASGRSQARKEHP